MPAEMRLQSLRPGTCFLVQLFPKATVCDLHVPYNVLDCFVWLHYCILNEEQEKGKDPSLWFGCYHTIHQNLFPGQQ